MFYFKWIHSSYSLICLFWWWFFFLSTASFVLVGLRKFICIRRRRCIHFLQRRPLRNYRNLLKIRTKYWLLNSYWLNGVFLFNEINLGLIDWWSITDELAIRSWYFIPLLIGYVYSFLRIIMSVYRIWNLLSVNLILGIWIVFYSNISILIVHLLYWRIFFFLRVI